MILLLTIVHILVCLLLVMAVLLQSGKGGGLASAIGGGLSSSSVLGGRSAASFLSKATTILATAFMVSCLVQAVIVRSANEAPTTALERVMQDDALPVTPVQLGGESQGGLLEEATTEAAATEEATESENE